MTTTLKIINPSNQNTTQKIGWFLSLSLAVICIFLHFPFEGYETEHYVTTDYGRAPCPIDFTMDKLKAATSEELSDHINALKKCQDRGEFQTLPLYSWASKAPIVRWFSTIGRTASACILILGIGFLWLYVFRDKNDD